MKTDLHLHSRHSNRPPEWFFRRVGLSDSYSEPRTLYTRLKEQGMDFVTLTDHDCLDGCLEIADLPGVFLSEQVTARFPEDRAPVHLLVWGLTEAQHGEIQVLRENIFDLQKYLAQERLTHAVAHPLYHSDDRLTVAHVEKLVLLFRHFEGINGLRDTLISAVARFAFGHLTREKIEELAHKHDMVPTHDEAWNKVLVGGSDDHGGLAPGCAWTETPEGVDWREYLQHVREGRCEAGGQSGSPLLHAHGVYGNIGRFITKRFSVAASSPLIMKAFSRFMEGKDPTEFTWGDKFGFFTQGLATGKIWEMAKPANASLWKQLSSMVEHASWKSLLAKETEGITDPGRRSFVIVNFLLNQLAYRFFTSFLKHISAGNIIEAVQEISTLLPLLATLTPYLYSFKTEVGDRQWLGEVSKSLTGNLSPHLRNTKRAWFTDTLEDVNGVANTIRKLTAACVEAGHDLTVVTSRKSPTVTGIPLKNFEPIGEFELPEYELQKLSFPPILQMLDWVQREGFTELIISTPGPVGITALLAGQLFGLRTSGIYHTDFPQYVRILSDDSLLESLTWNYMKWFYDSLNLLYVNSEGYRSAWVGRGIKADKLRILPRGLDLMLFQPSRRDAAFWTSRGLPQGATVCLYVGRISREKDLGLLVDVWTQLQDEGVAFAFVGDGPFRAELQRMLPQAAFTGYLGGVELATAYASADVFVFPSTTDTFGNVILEALACGLPCVVSDQGGPRDLIDHGGTGFVTRALDATDFANHVRQIAKDHELRSAMSARGCKAVEDRNWTEAGQRFWDMTSDAYETPGKT